ncbi:unnamed protein product [Strongylus vulgaris]|uniref:Uncharacterized protein n=1 Tax=Strongylus vulgaris TaxID=40348 RepID=A0A3P7IPU5_STRVU|nr:unnamed protein product [Strongylus vulgaris]
MWLSPYDANQLFEILPVGGAIAVVASRDQDVQYTLHRLRAPVRRKPRSNYAQLSRSLSHGESFAGYNKNDNTQFSPRSASSHSQYTSSTGAIPLKNPFVTPTGQLGVSAVNFTSDFPELGDGSHLDDGFAPQYRPASATSPYGTMTTNTGYGYGTLNSNGYGGYSTLSSNNGYSTLGRGGIAKHSRPPSPYGSLKSRKGVSWLDQERARSLSPANGRRQVSVSSSRRFSQVR